MPEGVTVTENAKISENYTGNYFSFLPDISIHYRVLGHGPCQVVFLHGFAAATATWDDIAPLFPADEFTLYLLDLQGFGLSSKPRRDDYGVLRQADILLSFVREKSLLGAAVVGHSLGGSIALAAWLRAKSEGLPLMSRLVLIGAPAYPQPLPRFLGYLRRPLVGDILLRLVPVRTLVQRSLENVFYDKSLIDEERIRRYSGFYAGAGTAGAFVQTVRRLVNDRHDDLVCRYGEIDVPVLLLWGGRDRIVRPAVGDRLAGELPRAILHVIPDCGHNPHEERPALAAEYIISFLRETSPRL